MTDLVALLTHGGAMHGAGTGAGIVPTLPSAAGGGFVSFTGDTIQGTITGITAHGWVDDAQGLFHTGTDLNAEWVGYYQQMIEGHGASLLPAQRLEGQAEAMFMYTALGRLPATQQGVIQQDVQREIDAIGAAMRMDGITGAQPLTAQTYLEINHTILNTPALLELGVQGHGLNNPPLPRYDGYTNDAQNLVADPTLYVGPGPDHGERAIRDFMDDSVMTHMVFPVVEKNGVLVQLNQNGNKEETLAKAVTAVDRMMFGPVLTAKDFSTPKS